MERVFWGNKLYGHGMDSEQWTINDFFLGKCAKKLRRNFIKSKRAEIYPGGTEIY